MRRRKGTDKKSSNDRKLIEIWKAVTEGDVEEEIVSEKRRDERGNSVDNSKQNGKF